MSGGDGTEGIGGRGVRDLAEHESGGGIVHLEGARRADPVAVDEETGGDARKNGVLGHWITIPPSIISSCPVM